MIVSAAIGTVGAVYSADQNAKAANAEADQAELNAIQAQREGAAAEDATRRQRTQMLGLQRAAAAESGFDPNTGSLAMLQVKSAGETELDALTARYQGTMQGIGQSQRAAGLRNQAGAARTSGYLSAAGTIAGAAGTYYGGTKVNNPTGGGYYMNGGGAGF
jgi:hypothetical protein